MNVWSVRPFLVLMVRVQPVGFIMPDSAKVFQVIYCRQTRTEALFSAVYVSHGLFHEDDVFLDVWLERLGETEIEMTLL